MIITLNNVDYELSAKLGTVMSLEKKFNQPLGQLFQRLGEANVDELVSILNLAAAKEDRDTISGAIIDALDYVELVGIVTELIANLMFSGTPEQKEAKIQKYPAPEEAKNAIRERLGLPLPEAPLTGTD